MTEQQHTTKSYKHVKNKFNDVLSARYDDIDARLTITLGILENHQVKLLDRETFNLQDYLMKGQKLKLYMCTKEVINIGIISMYHQFAKS